MNKNESEGIMKTLFLIVEWSDFYNEANFGKDIPEPISNTLTGNFNTHIDQNALKQSDAYVVDCFFYLIRYFGDGAAVSIYKSGARFFVECSTFAYCETINGNCYGAINIHFADFAMNRVCGYRCESNYRCSFAVVEHSGRSINAIRFSALSNCHANYWYTMYNNYGHVEVKSTNFSHNYAYSFSTILCSPSSLKNKQGCAVSYSSLANNTAKNQYCIYFTFSGEAETHDISHSNIVENSGNKTICIWNGEATISNTCILKNKGMSHVFYLQSPSSKCTLIDCSIDNFTYFGSGNMSQIGSFNKLLFQ